MKRTAILVLLALVAGTLFGGAAPTTQQRQNVSKAVEKDGLEVTVSMPEELKAKAGLAFSVSMKNVLKEKSDLTLIDADVTYFWAIVIKEVGKDGFWQVVHVPFKEMALGTPRPTQLKPGESVKVDVQLLPKNVALMWQGIQNRPLESLEALPAGEYELTVEFELQRRGYSAGADPVWEGRVKTEPMRFKVAKAGAQRE